MKDTTSRPIRQSTLILALAAALTFTSRAEPFTLFLYETKADFASRTDPAKAPAYWESYGKFAKQMTDAGILRGGAPLHDSSKATSLQITNSTLKETAGSTTTSEKSLGGYFIIDVPNLAVARDWAAKAPVLPAGAVEIRPHYPAPTAPTAPTK